MNLIRLGTLSQIAAMPVVERIGKAGIARSSFIEGMHPPERLATPRHKLLVPS